jgi:hypothetical protein
LSAFGIKPKKGFRRQYFSPQEEGNPVQKKMIKTKIIILLITVAGLLTGAVLASLV